MISSPPGRTSRCISVSQRAADRGPKCDQTETAKTASSEPSSSVSGGSCGLTKTSSPGRCSETQAIAGAFGSQPSQRTPGRQACSARRCRADEHPKSSTSAPSAKVKPWRNAASAIRSAVQKSPPAASGPRAIAWMSSGGMSARSPVRSSTGCTWWQAAKISVSWPRASSGASSQIARVSASRLWTTASTSDSSRRSSRPRVTGSSCS